MLYGVTAYSETPYSAESERFIALYVSENTDSLAAAIAAIVNVSLNVTEPSDTASAAVNALVSVNLAATESPDSLAANVEAIFNAVLAVTEPLDHASIVVKVRVSGQLLASESPDTFSASIERDLNPAYLDATEARDSIQATINAVVTGQLSVTEAADSIAAVISGLVVIQPGKRTKPSIPQNSRDDEKQYRGKELAESGRETRPEMRQRINTSQGRTNYQVFRRIQPGATRNNTTNGRR